MDEAISYVDFIEDEQDRKDESLNPIVIDCINQLDEYFLGKRAEFNIKLSLGGTKFQKSVWQALIEIPFGVTKSYKDIAVSINNEKAVRAVGGVWRKEWLLKHEVI